MYAWLDLTDRKAKGEFVKEKDLKKHKYDVFRLMSIIDESAKIELTGLVKEKTSEFIERIQDEQLSLSSINEVHELEESLEILKAMYLGQNGFLSLVVNENIGSFLINCRNYH